MNKQYDYYREMDEITKLADEWEQENEWKKEMSEYEQKINVLPAMKHNKLIPNGKLKLPRIIKRKRRTESSLPF